MDLKKMTDGKKTYSGLAILAITPFIVTFLKQLEVEGSQVIATELAGNIVGGLITVYGIFDKWIKARLKSKTKTIRKKKTS